MRAQFGIASLLGGLLLSAPAHPTSSPSSKPPGPITEITLTRVSGLGAGPQDRVVLRSDGTARYEGRRNVPRLGDYTAHLPKSNFDHLADLFDKNKFFELHSKYLAYTDSIPPRPLTDVPRIITSVVRDNQRKTVENYGFSGPEALRELEQEILKTVEKLKWKRAPIPPQNSTNPPS